MKKLELVLSPASLQVIVDSPPHGITFSQFIVLTSDFEALLTDEMFEVLFSLLDINNTKKVNAENIVSAFNRAGIEIDKTELFKI